MSEHISPIRLEDQRELALLYVKLHATPDSTPEKLCDLYREACTAIQAYSKGDGSMKIG